MLQISQLCIYPVKSLGGISLNSARVTDRGLQHDRRWMLVDSNNRFITQREHVQMAFFKPELVADGIKINYVSDGSFFVIPFTPLTDEQAEVTIWNDTCTGQFVSEKADEWFSRRMGFACRLVYMPDETHRQTDLRYTQKGTVTSFSDAYPALIIGQSSLDDLNSRLAEPLPMDRFRPNIVFTGGLPYGEDTMEHIVINNIDMYGVKLCARCMLTTIDQVSAKKGKEPLKTLATYRTKNNKIMFGQNLVMQGEGWLSVGDLIEVVSVHKDARFLIGNII